MGIEGINLDDPRVPEKWKQEMLQGTAFGIKAIEAIKKMQAVKQTRPTPAVALSDIGTQIRKRIREQAKVELTCGTCLQFLRSLNETDQHEHEAIVEFMSAEFPWPAEWREKNTQRRQAISAMIADIVAPTITGWDNAHKQDSGSPSSARSFLQSHGCSGESD